MCRDPSCYFAYRFLAKCDSTFLRLQCDALPVEHGAVLRNWVLHILRTHAAQTGAFSQPLHVAPANRLVDFGESHEALGPIHGVFDDSKTPAVSYTVAIGAIISLDLQVLYQARQFLKSSRCDAALAAAPALKPDHAAALWLYTCESPLYRRLSHLLRGRNRQDLMK